jgi:hypothetical protein
MAMKNARDLFAQIDQQVSVLKERIACRRLRTVHRHAAWQG